MGIEYIILFIVATVIIFAFSFSLVLNLILFIGLVSGGLFLKNVLSENNTLQNEMSDLDSQLIMSDSINSIIEHILVLRDELFEITQMELYNGEPVIQGLMERVVSTLEKIENSVINQEYLRSIQERNE